MKTAETMYQEIQPLLENKWEQAAMSAYDKLLEAHPTYAQAHFDLAMLCLKHQQDDDALIHLQESVELAPYNADYKKLLADFYYTKRGKADKAFAIYQDLVEMDPHNAQMHLIAGNLAVALNRFDVAVSCYEKVLAIDSSHTEAQDFIAKLKRHMQDSPDQSPTAEEMYAKVQALVSGGDNDGAVMMLKRLIHSYPDFALGHNDLGVLYCQVGEMDKAVYHYEEARRLDPDNMTIRKNLTEFHFVQTGNYSEALHLGLEILKQDPEDAETLMMAGHINYALDRQEDARLFYARVLEIEPWHFEASQCLSKLEGNEESNTVALATTEDQPHLH